MRANKSRGPVETVPGWGEMGLKLVQVVTMVGDRGVGGSGEEQKGGVSGQTGKGEPWERGQWRRRSSRRRREA